MAQKHISIKLWFEDEKKFKTFIAPRTNTKTLLEALRLNAEAEKTADDLEESIKILEKQMQFIVKLFADQFSYEELFEGLESYAVGRNQPYSFRSSWIQRNRGSGTRFFAGEEYTYERGIQQINEIYSTLLEQGWKMTEIDNMDIYHYLEVLAEKNKPKIKTVTIDQIF